MSTRVAILSIFILIAGGVISCTKKEAPQTPFTKIQGKWRLAKTATDDNGNRQIDDNEIHPVPSVQINEITFNSDNTGLETNVYNGVTSAPLHFDWTITEKDSVWCAYAGHDTISYYLASITASNLALQTNTSYGLAAYYYNKK